MAVVLDVIKRSLRMIGELAAETGEAPNAAQAANALTTLNGMIASWEQRGVRLEMPTLTLAGTIPLPATYDDAIAYGLAVALAGEFGIDPPPAVVARHRDTFRALQMTHAYAPRMTAEPAYLYLGRAGR